MDSQIKKSFGKVKADYLRLANEVLDVSGKLNRINKQIELSEDVKIQIKRLEKINLEKFVVNMEKEFKSINTLITQFNERFNETSKFMEDFNTQLKKYQVEIVDLKNKFHSTQNRAENTNLDVEQLNESLGEMQELINEKVDMQTNGLRMEMMEEIAKLYDILTNERVETKSAPMPKKIQKSPKTKTKDGKIKKAVKWLFVDEDEDNTLGSIKDEIKNN